MLELGAVSATNSKFVRLLLVGWNARNCSCLKYKHQSLLKKPPEICWFNLYNLGISKTMKSLSKSETCRVINKYEEKNKDRAGKLKIFTLTQEDKVISNESVSHWTDFQINVRINRGSVEEQFQNDVVELKEINAVRIREIYRHNYIRYGTYIGEREEIDGINEETLEDHTANIKRAKETKGVKRDKTRLRDRKMKRIDLNKTKEPRAKESEGVKLDKTSFKDHKMNSMDLKETKEPGEDDVELPEEPTTCCMSGCANCVWIEYAEKLNELFSGESDKTKRIILEKVKDPNMKAFLQMELDKKKDEDGNI